VPDLHEPVGNDRSGEFDSIFSRSSAVLDLF
jgi:hypothetical protein